MYIHQGYTISTPSSRYRALFGQAEDIRRSGSAALDLAYTAAGRDGIPESGNIIAGNLNVAKAMIDAIGAHATPALLKA